MGTCFEFLLLCCAVNFTTFLSMHMYIRVVTCIIVIVLEYLDCARVIIINCLVTMVFVTECLLVFRVSCGAEPPSKVFGLKL